MKKQPIYLLILFFFSCGEKVEFTEDLTILDRSSAMDCNCEITITNPNEFILFPNVYTYGICQIQSGFECLLCAASTDLLVFPGEILTHEFQTPEKYDISGNGNIEFNQIHMSVSTGQAIDQTCIPVDIVLSCGADTINMSEVFENSVNNGFSDEKIFRIAQFFENRDTLGDIIPCSIERNFLCPKDCADPNSEKCEYLCFERDDTASF